MSCRSWLQRLRHASQKLSALQQKLKQKLQRMLSMLPQFKLSMICSSSNNSIRCVALCTVPAHVTEGRAHTHCWSVHFMCTLAGFCLLGWPNCVQPTLGICCRNSSSSELRPEVQKGVRQPSPNQKVCLFLSEVTFLPVTCQVHQIIACNRRDDRKQESRLQCWEPSMAQAADSVIAVLQVSSSKVQSFSKFQAELRAQQRQSRSHRHRHDRKDRRPRADRHTSASTSSSARNSNHADTAQVCMPCHPFTDQSAAPSIACYAAQN